MPLFLRYIGITHQWSVIDFQLELLIQTANCVAFVSLVGELHDSLAIRVTLLK
jgi:hypothetical protein